MAWATKTYTFSPATVAKSSEVNQNFDDMVDQLNTAMPSGGIILWSGAVAAIPAGWYLCNGANGTPDLRDRFVVGAGNSYSVADTGGEATHTLTVDEMPSHRHGADSDGGTDNSTAGYFRREGGNIGQIYTAYTGGGAAHENRPPYYALAYIMKS